MKSLLLLVAATAFLALPARAETVVRRVTGHGSTHDDAVRVGLVEAVRQVSGAALQSTSSATLSAKDATASSTDSSGAESSSSSSVSVQTLDEKTDTVTKGVVAGYTVISESEDHETGTWKIEMDVSVAVYKTPGLSPDSRRKIAILPFKTVGDYPIGASLLAAETVSSDMSDRLIALFTQSRRFAVLTRQDEDVLKAEKELIVREAPAAEMAKIGQTLGADYILAGTVSQLAVGSSVSKANALTGASTTSLPYARLGVKYRIIVVATGQIKFADDIFVDFDRTQLRAMRGDTGRAYEELKREAARRIAWRSLSAIYPAHVVDLLENGEIVFDEGGALVLPGTYFDVFRLGAKVKSHSSGESLGRTEEKIATILVTRVDAKMSYGRVAEGAVTWDDFDQGIIVRPFRPVLELAPGGAAPGGYGVPAAPAGGVVAPSSPSGGVKLPFD